MKFHNLYSIVGYFTSKGFYLSHRVFNVTRQKNYEKILVFSNFMKHLNPKYLSYLCLPKGILFNHSRSNLLEVVCKQGVLKNFAKLAGKCLSRSLLFNKLIDIRLQLYQNGHSDKGGFL